MFPPYGSVQGPDWGDQRCFILGGGPSLTGFDFEQLQGRTIGINRMAFEADTDVLFSLDQHFHDAYQTEIQRFAEKGREVYLAMPHLDFPRIVTGVVYLKRMRGQGLSPNPQEIRGVNSGYGSIDLCVHKKARDIALLGMDMQYGPGGESHCHDGYPWQSPNAQRMMERWALCFSQLAEELPEHITITNYLGNPRSRITAFPTALLEEL